MVYQKKSTNSFYIKKWVVILTKIFLKKGKKSMASVNVDLLLMLIKKSKNLNHFFYILSKNLFIPVVLRKKVVAGKKLFIPTRCSYHNENKIFINFLNKALKARTEKNLVDKAYKELFDIFNKKGISIKSRIQYCKEIKLNMPNLRFLTNI